MTPERWRQVTAVFHAALGLDRSERTAFVASSCGSDAALRQEVAAMLGAHEQAGGFGEAASMAAGESSPSVMMPFIAGVRFGYCEIESLLGAGGMGAVYRARDTRLHRDVALKTLLPAVARDAAHLARFAREARTLASLNHPNIAQVYGLEEADGVSALVMELVNGPTLADRIARRAIPIGETLEIVRQIAEALEAAHEHGIVHRDLKPANVKLRPDGTVKVLDFGLAKSVHHTMDGGEESEAIPPASLTTPGLILGTAAYMSPEQARGQEADRRADIWAVGCVLFEMLTARRPFAGGTLSDVLVRILEHEPDWRMLPASTPSAIRRLLHRCLEKDPRRRLDSAAVVRIEIDEAVRESTQVAPPGARRASSWGAIVWAAIGAGAAVLVMMTPASRPNPSDPPRPMTATSVFVARGLEMRQPGVHFAVAPNGRAVVFAGYYSGRRVLYLRQLDRVEPEPIAGTDGGSDAFFSHDGRALGFETRSELWTVPLDGGSTQRLVPNQPLRGGSWGEGNRIVVGRVGSGLWLAAMTRGESRQLTAPEQGERHELPEMLPGGRAVLFTMLSLNKPPRAALYLLESGETHPLFEGIGARFVSSGHVVFGRQGKLWAVPFDLASLRTAGAAQPVRDDVHWSGAGYPQFTTGGDVLAYVRMNQSSDTQASAPTWTNRQGTEHTLPLKANNFMLPRWSPDGNRFVVQIGTTRDLWTYDFSRGTLTKLTSDRVIAYSAPAWSPDGSRVTFATWFEGNVGLGSVPSDGSGPVEVLVKDVGMRSFERTHPVMLPDGSGVIMTGLAPGASVEDLLFVSLTGDRRLAPLFQESGVERNPAIAPNGRFIAYNSDESGHTDVYVRPYPDAGARRWQISTEGGAGPVWTRKGSEIVYMDTQGRMMAVAVRQNRSDGTDEFNFSKPEPLFTVEMPAFDGVDRGWDVTPDGERFLFVPSGRGASELDAALELTLIHNWTDELKRVVPRERE
jgi:Tol biopolymer transport system component/tRNA A-37 threonylcarbamoyl transferase component Bud32